jgi:hypothetical protein
MRSPALVNAPAPYGARRQQPSGVRRRDNGDGDARGAESWSKPTSFHSTAAPDVARVPVYDKLPERGLPGWAAVLVLLVIAGIGGLIDTISGSQVRGGYNWGIVVASVVAILVVRRSGMFPVVIAPPLVYSLGSAGMLYIRSSGLHDRRVLFDGATNWLVYGFPAIAAATAAVLIIAGIRMITRR